MMPYKLLEVSYILRILLSGLNKSKLINDRKII
jgi:hypothetical protein